MILTRQFLWFQQEKEKQEIEQAKKKTSGKEFRLLSGRALFVYNPELFVDDADALDDNEYETVEPEEEEEVHNERMAPSQQDHVYIANYHEEEEIEGENEVWSFASLRHLIGQSYHLHRPLCR